MKALYRILILTGSSMTITACAIMSNHIMLSMVLGITGVMTIGIGAALESNYYESHS